jgi:oligopeptide/dipeptide ABC transporter ATP-binding protein
VTVIFISHDLSVIHTLCSRVMVMYAGQIVETGPLQVIFEAPRHPYTRLLIDSIPSVEASSPRAEPPVTSEEHVPKAAAQDIPGEGCPFAPRCPLAMEICPTARPRAKRLGDAHHASCHAV